LDASTNIDFDKGGLAADFGKLLVVGSALLNSEGSLVQLKSKTVNTDKMMAEYFIK
jgi:hypothetical protein